MSKNSGKKNQKSKQSETNYFFWLVKNIIAAGIVAFIIIKVIAPFNTYKYLFDSLHTDMKIIKKHPLKSTTIDQRYRIVLGSAYIYLETIKENTPEDAVILYPEYESFFPKDEKPIFKNEGITNKMWAIRFLHPRIIVRPSELEHSPYKDKLTHVAIVNGRGIEYLPYKDELKIDIPYGVLPINTTEEELQYINYQTQNNN